MITIKRHWHLLYMTNCGQTTISWPSKFSIMDKSSHRTKICLHHGVILQLLFDLFCCVFVYHVYIFDDFPFVPIQQALPPNAKQGQQDYQSQCDWSSLQNDVRNLSGESSSEECSKRTYTAGPPKKKKKKMVINNISLVSYLLV